MMEFFSLQILSPARNRSRPFQRLYSGKRRKSNLMIVESDLTSQTFADQELGLDPRIRLNNLVLEAVFQGLSHFGGSNVVESLIYILELEHSVNLRNIVNELDTLRSGLAKMFGGASYVVEEKVRNNLAKSLGLDPDGRSLEQLVETAKNLIQQDSAQNPKVE